MGYGLVIMINCIDIIEGLLFNFKMLFIREYYLNPNPNLTLNLNPNPKPGFKKLYSSKIFTSQSVVPNLDFTLKCELNKIALWWYSAFDK